MTSIADIRIDHLISSLSSYLEIYNHLCNLDPAASKTLMPCLKEISGLIMQASMEYEQLSGIMADYRSSTAAAIRKEKEAAENEKK